MTGEQRYVFGDGSVKPLPSWKAPGQKEQMEILNRAFGGFSALRFEWRGKKADRVRKVDLYDKDGDVQSIRFAMRAVSGGGRSAARPNELRVQLAPELINDLFEMNNAGNVGLVIGVYRNDNAEALVLWRPLDRSGGNGSGSASKQINADVIAAALINGIGSYVYPDGEVVYAVRPELFRAYLNCFMPDRKASIVRDNDLLSSNLDAPHNLIYFGAPGTGKSYQLNLRALGGGNHDGLFPKGNVRRVTFYYDYTYAQFVGCFKPYVEPKIDEESSATALEYAPGRIEYKFVPGPFIDTYVDAITHPEQNYLLIIEEINRANPAAVFGDVFQLLDRKDDGSSEYSIATSEDLRWYLFKRCKSYLNGVGPQKEENFLYTLDDPEAKRMASSMSLPSNMYIWATMNSADQGVFPMDTAFKRRWDFKYMKVNDEKSVSVISEYDVPLSAKKERVNWNELREAINGLLREARVNEDKWLGPFFIKPRILANDDTFRRVFKNKVLLYLYEDAAKTKHDRVFADGLKTYSELCDDFDKNGLGIFKGMDGLVVIPDDAENIDVSEE